MSLFVGRIAANTFSFFQKMLTKTVQTQGMSDLLFTKEEEANTWYSVLIYNRYVWAHVFWRLWDLQEQ